ncbi:Disease resistance protein RPM1 [Rhynchospora pubera]|uniref:Disease resistance protein RPM1 n=1 Tax=Rhynchospora pubera TaxID=906938 RepID=A0AAV8F0N3_9POAL|nr:Disease resistance protein RPM1 [Rhynchospora pubera]
MEVASLSMATSAISFGIKAVSKVIANEINLLEGAKDDLYFIHEELKMMQAFLRATSTKDMKGETEITWISQVRELAFDVEDCINEASVCQMDKSCLSSMCSVKIQDHFARKIKGLKNRIEEVSKRNKRYDLTKSLDADKNGPIHCHVTSIGLTANDEDLLVGLAKPMEELVELVLQEHAEQKVISVIGMGGAGKTTLVRNVYSSQKLSNQFEFVYWYNVLHPFKIEDFIERLAKKISVDENQKGGMKGQISEGKLNIEGNKTKIENLLRKKSLKEMTEEMEMKVMEYLNNKKYVIVIDDLLSKSEWNLIEPKLPKSTGSRIIVTTRSTSLAEDISHSSDDIFEIQTLEENHAKDLFFKAVYKTNHCMKESGNKIEDPPHESKSNMKCGPSSSEINEENPEAQNQCMMADLITTDMETQASLIIDKCNRLPIAIVTIGGYLATKPKTSVEWKAMHDNLSSELANNTKLDKVKTVLSSSYDGMPYHLKSCLLYLSVFHNHHEIRRTRIIRRWMAEGYVMEDRNKMAYDVGKGYFYDLMGRSLIRPSQMTIMVNGDVNRCDIHDVIYEILILEKSMDENVLSLLEDDKLRTKGDKVRHLMIRGNSPKEESVLDKLELSHMRSLSIFRKVGSKFRYSRMKLLRVLDLEGTTDFENQDLKKIGKLRHLKYLGLRGTKVTKLPKSLQKLLDLETLDIRNTAVEELPEGFIMLRKLSYLRSGFDLYNIQDPRKEYYNVLDIIGFVSIITLMIPFMPVLALNFCTPLSIDDLLIVTAGCALTICPLLIPFCIYFSRDKNKVLMFGSYGVKVPRGIKNLSALHTLGMVDVGESKSLVKEIKHLTNLRKLAVTGFSNENGKEIAEVIDTLNHLRSLVLSAADYTGLSRCLAGVHSPPKYLQSLKLYSPIGQLPDWIRLLENLVKVELRYTELESEQIKMLGELRNLTILRMLMNSFKGKQLNFGPGAFRKLKVLIIEKLETLTSVSFEERSMLRLENLEINRCRSLGEGGLTGLLFLERMKEILVKYEYYEEPESMQFNENIQALEIELRDTLSGHPIKSTLKVMRY